MSKIATEDESLVMGARLASIRAGTRLSQGEFAERIGVSPRAYQNYERGEREAPPSVLRRVCETYGADPAWLLCGADVSPSLLGQIVNEVDIRLKKAGRRLPAATKVHVVTLLYVHFCDKPSVDGGYVDQVLALTA